MPCPCGLPAAYDACCGRFIAGPRHAETAEQLMRSRYTAYVKGAVDYLIVTTTIASRAGIDRVALVAYCRTLRGISLKILGTVAGGPIELHGVVEFAATLRAGGRKFVQRERSRFVVEDGRWVYVDGELGERPVN